MGWSVVSGLDAFDVAVRPFLEASPVEHTVMLTLLDGLHGGIRWSDAAPLFVVRVGPGATVTGAALATPPHPLLVAGSAATVDVEGLVSALVGHDVAGVNALEPVAVAFAAAWTRARNVSVREAMRTHLLELDVLLPPRSPSGAARLATVADSDVVHDLTARMRSEIHEPGDSPRQLATDRIAAGAVTLWDVGGVSVALASSTPRVAAVSRIATVYTLPHFRRRGIAAAVTAAGTAAALAAGAERVCLFTDAANPTSNGVYERLGFRREPDDTVVLRFGS